MSRKDMIHIGVPEQKTRVRDAPPVINLAWTFSHKLHILSRSIEGDERVAHFCH
jgi:hypothetical protein